MIWWNMECDVGKQFDTGMKTAVEDKEVMLLEVSHEGGSVPSSVGRRRHF